MFTCTWEYHVYPDRIDEFRAFYGSEGGWVKLFRRAKGYLRTELFEDLEISGRFVTTDFWESRQHWEKMKHDYAEQYDCLDRACESLTEDETLIGLFEVC